MTHMNRRTVLRASAGAAIATGAQCFTGIPALADYAVGPTVRRNASAMSANDPILRGYRKAITAMRALPDDNPCSWFYQAAIHGTTDPRNLTAWNTCHTNSSFFWAWHRMYLYWFERIVRKYSGMYDWAIPYWDWTNTSERAIPAPFRASGSPLFDATRKTAMNAGGLVSNSLGISVNNAMTLLNYFTTQTSINPPHGSIHTSVGGNMSVPWTAAQDPLFYIHHSEVDRQWNQWLAQGGGRSSPIGDATWRNTTYTFFDECCKEVKMKGCDVLRAAKQLSYSYEGEPAQVEQYCPRTWNPGIIDLTIIDKLPSPFLLDRDIVRIPPGDPIKQRSLTATLREGKEPVFLKISGVEAETQPGVSWEVYYGPKGLKPNPKSPYFVGIFALFSAGLKDRGHHYEPAEFIFPISKALRNKRDRVEFEVTFVPTNGLERDEKGAEAIDLRSPVSVREIAFGVDRAMPAAPADEQRELKNLEDLN